MLIELQKSYNGSNLEPFIVELSKRSNVQYQLKNGNKARWQNALEQLKYYNKSNISVQAEYLFIDEAVDCAIFETLKPWRKGPYRFRNFKLESEWRSDLKWQRIKTHINLKDKTVLDVGSGNGYFMILMALSGAKIALGLEPFLLFNYQFQAIKHLANNINNVNLLPLKLEQISDMAIFDIVFSMGVLYHHPAPIEHILKLKKMLTVGGELVLETLIVDGEKGYSLMPKDRYAKMRNVWFIPTVKTLMSWLERCGFDEIRIIDNSLTTIKEQRKTSWIGKDSQSLVDFIKDGKTIEGYPAPQRLILICKEK